MGGICKQNGHSHKLMSCSSNYNQDTFHLRHGRTVEKKVMRCFARELGYGEEEDFWGIVGLLHGWTLNSIEEHCIKSQRLMQQAGLEPEIIHATASPPMDSAATSSRSI